MADDALLSDLTPTFREELLRLDTVGDIMSRLAEAGHAKLGRRIAIANAVLRRRAMHASGRETATAEGSTRRFRVVHKPCVYVRQTASTSAQRLGTKWPGDTVVAEEGASNGDWLKLVGEEGWVLRDGSSIGLGMLLEALPNPPPGGGPLPSAAEWPLIVMCSDGLCNRLRVVLSYALVAQWEGRPLTIVWPRTKECSHGLFADAFAPLPNVTFVETAPQGVRPAFPPNSHDFHPLVKGTAAEDQCYALLALRPELAATVEACVRQCGPHFASVHIRRTDHWGSEVTDTDFERFVGNYPRHNVFIATDSRDTQVSCSVRRSCAGAAHHAIADESCSLIALTGPLHASCWRAGTGVCAN